MGRYGCGSSRPARQSPGAGAPRREEQRWAGPGSPPRGPDERGDARGQQPGPLSLRERTRRIAMELPRQALSGRECAQLYSHGMSFASLLTDRVMYKRDAPGSSHMACRRWLAETGGTAFLRKTRMASTRCQGKPQVQHVRRQSHTPASGVTRGVTEQALETFRRRTSVSPSARRSL